MKTYNLCITFILHILLCSAATAQVTDENQVFNLLCKEDKSIGFQWQNNEWKQVRFAEETFLLSKLDNKNDNPFCKDLSSTNQIKRYTDLAFSKGCYVLKKIGEKSGVGNKCNERWIVKENYISLHDIRCDGIFDYIKADIDGEFVKSNTSYINSIKDAEKKHEGYISMSIGKCSLLR